MNPNQQKQQAKATALNAIRKLYNPLNKISYSHYPDDGSYAEQRESIIKRIIENLEKELQKIKEKTK